MTLIEILTAISLFCPQVRIGGPYETSPAPIGIDQECSRKAWKCIDKERKRVWDHNIKPLAGHGDAVAHEDFEKCFR